MAATAKTRAIQDLEVVDADVHVADKSEKILPYLGDPYNKLLREDIVSGEAPLNVFPRSGHIHPSRVGKIEKRQVGSVDEARAARDLLGTNKIILTPGKFMRVYGVRNTGLGHAMAVAYNDWMLDTFLDHDQDLYGVICINPLAPHKAADEVRDRAREDKFVGVMIPGGVVPPLGHTWYDPIYKAAQREGLPIVSHICGLNTPIHFPHQWYWNEMYIDHKVPSFPAEYMHHLSNMLTSGVPVRFPDLKFVIQEVGLGWIPFFLERYDHCYHGNQHDAPMLEKKPSEYIRDQFYFSTQPSEGVDNPDYIVPILKLIGAENLIFATDYPHHDFEHTDDMYRVFSRAFDQEEVKGLFGGNANEVFAF